MRDETYCPFDSEEIGAGEGKAKAEDNTWTAVIPVPEGYTSYWPCDRRGKRADSVWKYNDVEGRLLGLVARWNLPPDDAGKKHKRILPYTWCRDALGREEWRAKHFPEPRPLYGLDRLAARPAVHNDSLLCLDELAQVSSQDAGAMTYMLANGKGKSRSTRELRARKAVQWRLLYLSSGEISLADKIAEDGRGRKETAGQRVRVVELPADTGMHGLFENLHGFADAAQFAKGLSAGAKTYYGMPARAFLAKISQDLESVKNAIRAGVLDFVAGNCPGAADGQVRRVAERFGIAAAAGELAIGLELVPWQPGETVNAAAICFRLGSTAGAALRRQKSRGRSRQCGLFCLHMDQAVSRRPGKIRR